MAFLSQAKTGALASSDKVSRLALPHSWFYLLALSMRLNHVCECPRWPREPVFPVDPRR